MVEFRTHIGKNGRVVIPSKLREALGLESGQEIILRLENDQLRLIPLYRAITLAQARVKKYVPEGTSLVDALIQERRNEVERE